ncbi:hypothetical protein GQ457_16G013920 [Hibiscus cannabinus]
MVPIPVHEPFFSHFFFNFGSGFIYFKGVDRLTTVGYSTRHFLSRAWVTKLNCFRLPEYSVEGLVLVTKQDVSEAIKLGYRRFDRVSLYSLESALGEAIIEAISLGLIKSRNELFITSKLWCTHALGIVNLRSEKFYGDKAYDFLPMDCQMLGFIKSLEVKPKLNCHFTVFESGNELTVITKETERVVQ